MIDHLRQQQGVSTEGLIKLLQEVARGDDVVDFEAVDDPCDCVSIGPRYAQDLLDEI